MYSGLSRQPKGNGTHQFYIDDRANDERREAILRIARGEDTEPMATHFSVYHEMSSNRFGSSSFTGGGEKRQRKLINFVHVSDSCCPTATRFIPQ